MIDVKILFNLILPRDLQRKIEVSEIRRDVNLRGARSLIRFDVTNDDTTECKVEVEASSDPCSGFSSKDPSKEVCVILKELTHHAGNHLLRGLDGYLWLLKEPHM